MISNEKTTFILKKKGLLSSDSLTFMMELYLPIIGKDATFLYLFLMNFLLHNDNKVVISDLIVLTRMTRQEFLLSRKSLESIGLISTFEKNGDPNVLLIINDPETPKNFFNNIVYKGLFINSTSKAEYERLCKKYSAKIDINGYTDVSARINDTFKINFDSDELNLSDDVELIGRNKGTLKDNFSEVKLINYIKNNSQFTAGSFSDDEIKNMHRVATLYGLSESSIGELVIKSSNIRNKIGQKLDLELLRSNAEIYTKTFSLDSLKKIHKKSTIVGSTSDVAKRIEYYENTSPREFLMSKQNNVELVASDKRIIDSLAFNFHFSNGMINALLDYIMTIKNGDLNRNYVEKVASNLLRKHVTDTLSLLECIESSKKKMQEKKRIAPNTTFAKDTSIQKMDYSFDTTGLNDSKDDFDDDEDYDII